MMMLESDLLQIIHRLIAMTKDQSDDIQKRDFYLSGQLVVRVYFNHITGVFKVVHLQSEEFFLFEILDLAAIEIYERLAKSSALLSNSNPL